MSLASREDLLTKFGRVTRRFREVELPVARETVRIRSLTEGELSRYQRKMMDRKGRGFDPAGMQKANRRLFTMCIVDDKGNMLFADDDTEKLVGMDAADASVLYEACTEHCGIDRADLGDLGEPEKNSETTSEDSSPSD